MGSERRATQRITITNHPSVPTVGRPRTRHYYRYHHCIVLSLIGNLPTHLPSPPFGVWQQNRARLSATWPQIRPPDNIHARVALEFEIAVKPTRESLTRSACGWSHVVEAPARPARTENLAARGGGILLSSGRISGVPSPSLTVSSHDCRSTPFFAGS